MRLAVISAPVAAAAGVAARSFQVISPSSALSPRVQITTAGGFRRPPDAGKHHIGARKRQHRSSTSFDCQASLS